MERKTHDKKKRWTTRHMRHTLTRPQQTHTNTKTHPGCKHLNNIGAAVLIKKGSLLVTIAEIYEWHILVLFFGARGGENNS